MALALALRNTSKIQITGLIQNNLLRSTTAAFTQHYSTLNKTKYVNLSPKGLLTGSQVRMMSADHSSLWALEKAVSVGLLAIVPTAIVMPNFILDNLLAVASVIHFHWGLEAVIIDYARPIVVGNVLPKLAMGLLYIISATTLGGLIYYNVNDIGIGKTIRKFWAINNKEV